MADDITKRMVDIKERVGLWRTDIKFAQVSEEQFEKQHEKKMYTDLRKKLIMMFDDVFKEDLTPEDRLDIPPVKIPWFLTMRGVHLITRREPLRLQGSSSQQLGRSSAGSSNQVP